MRNPLKPVDPAPFCRPRRPFCARPRPGSITPSKDLCDRIRRALAERFHQGDRRLDLGFVIRRRPPHYINRLRLPANSSPWTLAPGNRQVFLSIRRPVRVNGLLSCWLRIAEGDRLLRKLTKRMLGPYLGNARFMFAAPLAYRPGHFYSPICDPAELKRHYRDPDTTQPPNSLPGIDLARDVQLKNLGTAEAFSGGSRRACQGRISQALSSRRR